MPWKPTFSLVHASARPYQWEAVYTQYCRTAKDKDCFEYILCFDAAQRDEFEKTVPAGWMVPGTLPRPRLALSHPGDRNYVSAANWATKYAKAPVILEVTDDMFPPLRWDEELRELIPPFSSSRDHAADGARVVWVSDGHFREIMTMQIFTRKWYERYGYVFHPDFPSMNGDREFTWRANRDGVVIDVRDRKELHWDHQHHRNRKRKKDASDIPNESAERYAQGWTALNKHCPGYMKADPIDALYASACATKSDIYEHLPKLKALASSPCAACDGTGSEIIWAYKINWRSEFDNGCPMCKGAGRIPKEVLELGTRTGNSTIAFLAGRPKRLVSVDHDFSRLDPQVEGAAIYSGIPFSMAKVDSRTPMSPIASFDVAFFDTLHTYAHLKAEFATHAPHVRERLVMHDTVVNKLESEDGTTPGLWAAIQELVDAGDWEIEEHLENCCGLTILKRKKE